LDLGRATRIDAGSDAPAPEHRVSDRRTGWIVGDPDDTLGVVKLLTLFLDRECVRQIRAHVIWIIRVAERLLEKARRELGQQARIAWRCESDAHYQLSRLSRV
jgi:hypothetical protein